MSITPNQLKRLHILRREIGLDDEMRRGIISDRFGVDSFKKLTYDQAGQLITEWGKEKQEAWQKQKHEHGGASDKQINKIYAIAIALGARDMLDVLKKTEKFMAGRGKIKRKLASLSNLTPREANAVIEGMKSKSDREGEDPKVLPGPGHEKRETRHEKR